MEIRKINENEALSNTVCEEDLERVSGGRRIRCPGDPDRITTLARDENRVGRVAPYEADLLAARTTDSVFLPPLDRL